MDKKKDQDLLGLTDPEKVAMIDENKVFPNKKFDDQFSGTSLEDFPELFRTALKIIGFERVLLHRTLKELNNSLNLNKTQKEEFEKITKNLLELVPDENFSNIWTTEGKPKHKRDQSSIWAALFPQKKGSLFDSPRK